MTGCCANLKALSSHFSAILRMRSSSAAPLGVAAAVGLLGEAGILRPRPNRLERTSSLQQEELQRTRIPASALAAPRTLRSVKS